MPKERVHITVEDSVLNNREESDTTLAFEAGRWLAYADQTDTIGYDAFVKEAFHLDGETQILFEIPLLRGEEREAFIDEMEYLSRVTDVTFGAVV